MDQEMKAKWVKALRSGKYTQTAGALYSNVSILNKEKPGYCCLGVLARVNGVEDTYLQHCAKLDDISDICPAAKDSTEWLGPWEDHSIAFSTQSQLAFMNDSGKSFAEIADWIEASL